MSQIKALCAVAVLMLIPATTSAAIIYVDYLDPTGNGSPSSSFGAAYGVAGQWNALPFNATNAPVFDITGASTSVTVSNFEGSQVANHPSTSGDVEKLLDDGLDDNDEVSITISGLAAGAYDIYTYAWHPASAGDQVGTEITINGLSPQVVQRTGDFVGFSLGETHALHTITISPGEDVLILGKSVGTIGAAVVDGFQIVPVPEAQSLALSGLSLLSLVLFQWKRPTQ